MMPPPALQIYFGPCVTLTFDLLIPKVERFMPLSYGQFVPIFIKLVGLLGSNISCSQFGNRRANQRTDGRTNGRTG